MPELFRPRTEPSGGSAQRDPPFLRRRRLRLRQTPPYGLSSLRGAEGDEAIQGGMRILECCGSCHGLRLGADPSARNDAKTRLRRQSYFISGLKLIWPVQSFGEK
ncbi:hypothetical protein [Bradyrhizobium sp. SZCCHNRI1029]|uniref:hypothetical protein n=1 Tax=Bradyrhizobium sp. SZCCHNRI1029 TaxID=3057278 RepID=UPI002916F924|nr:hypothetical protein [Bradyrhizobium sp. SZCCHNRI1029]